MINLFCGYDAREAIGFHVFVQSVIARASEPVRVVPLAQMGLRCGSNSFTLSRFMVPALMGYRGHAIFADASDMLMLGDVAELDALFDPTKAVQVVKHEDYRTRHSRKYLGTRMECVNRDYERKNWASLMLINCEHPAWSCVHPESLKRATILDMLQLRFCTDEEIGELPRVWNVLADEGQGVWGANLLHWTAGIPAFRHYRNAPAAEHWHREREQLLEVA